MDVGCVREEGNMVRIGRAIPLALLIILVLVASPSAGTANYGIYDVLTAKLAHNPRWTVDEAKAMATAKECYLKEMVYSLLCNAGGGPMDGYTEEELRDVTVSRPIPILVAFSQPREEGVDAFLDTILFRGSYQFLVFHGDEPVAEFTMRQWRKEFRLEGYSERGNAMAMLAAMDRDPRSNQQLPLLLYVFDGDCFVWPDSTLTRPLYSAWTPASTIALLWRARETTTVDGLAAGTWAQERCIEPTPSPGLEACDWRIPLATLAVLVLGMMGVAAHCLAAVARRGRTQKHSQ